MAYVYTHICAEGRQLFSEGRWEEAARAFTEAIQEAPGVHVLLTNRALCNQKLERYLHYKSLCDNVLTCMVLSCVLVLLLCHSQLSLACWLCPKCLFTDDLCRCIFVTALVNC
jgi:hypothetical protein